MTDEAEFTIIHRNQCSKIFLASIHVAIIESEVINESHSGTGESVSFERTNHIMEYNTINIIARIMPVFSFNRVTFNV